MSNPFTTYAGLLERSTHLAHLYLHNDPMVLAYQVWGSESVNGAYGAPLDSGVGGAGPSAMFTMTRSQTFRSRTLRRKGLGMIDECRRGTTHGVFDVDDFLTVGGVIPPDDQWLFLRTQENRSFIGLLDFPAASQTTITLAAVVATDQVIIKGSYFEFAAGANNLAGRTGLVGQPFIVGLGADDDAAAANLTLALNDAGDVGAAMDLIAPLLTHTFATNPGAPSAIVIVQPEDAGANLIPGSTAQFAITTADAPRIVLDAATLVLNTFAFVQDAANPVLGPVYCVPPPIFMGMANPSASFAGIAPSGTGCVLGASPVFNEDLTAATPRPLYLVFPRPLSEVTLRNTSARAILVSFGVGQPMMSVVAGAEISLFSGSTKQVILACSGVGGATFTVHGVLGHV